MSATTKSAFPGNRRPPLLIGRVIAIYLAFALLPYFLALTQGLEQRGWLETSVSVLSIAGLTALLAQFVRNRVAICRDLGSDRLDRFTETPHFIFDGIVGH